MNNNNQLTLKQIERAARAAAIVHVLVNEARDNGGHPPATAEEFIEGLDLILAWYKRGAAIEQRAIKLAELAELLVYNYPKFGTALLSLGEPNQ
jgi:hypothetical protein